MSYADLEAARADRLKKAAAKESRKTAKRGRKRKSDGLEADIAWSNTKMTRFAEVLEPPGALENVSTTYTTGDVLGPQRAPVARMW